MDTRELVKWIENLKQDNELWKFYKSKEFRHLKDEVLEEQHYECQKCKEDGIITKADTVHHIQFVRKYPELALSKYYTYKGKQYRNLIAVCKSCHSKLHKEKGGFRQAKLYIVTGIAGAGKTTYVRNNIKNGIVYDLDYIVNAITYNNPNLAAIKITNSILKTFIDESMKLKNISVYIIRSSPNDEERELFDKYKAIYVDIETDIEVCRSRRSNISDEEFEEIIFKHKKYLMAKDINKNQEKFQERW